MNRSIQRPIGRFIVADERICHGRPTFVGARILVADVLEQIVAGLAWESIAEGWRGSISKDAIAEAVSLSSEVNVVPVLAKQWSAGSIKPYTLR
jgi:uncharacterized protein (DUF433 family)